MDGVWKRDYNNPKQPRDDELVVVKYDHFDRPPDVCPNGRMVRGRKVMTFADYMMLYRKAKVHFDALKAAKLLVYTEMKKCFADFEAYTLQSKKEEES